jgi:hypothetical protein
VSGPGSWRWAVVVRKVVAALALVTKSIGMAGGAGCGTKLIVNRLIIVK